jgi:hypothetical protein
MEGKEGLIHAGGNGCPNAKDYVLYVCTNVNQVGGSFWRERFSKELNRFDRGLTQV